MTARFIVGDVFDGLDQLEAGSVDLVVTSPPFLALRSYLPDDHPNKGREIGSEADPATFVDVMAEVVAALGRVLADHGSICVELGDTYAGSGGPNESGWHRPGPLGGFGDKRDQASREGRLQGVQATNPGRNEGARYQADGYDQSIPARAQADGLAKSGPGWPRGKSLAMVPESFRFALAYGMNPFTGGVSPAGRWIIRNVVRWARPNPPVGDLADKWRPATSDVTVATRSPRRYWDDLATRRSVTAAEWAKAGQASGESYSGGDGGWRHGRVRQPDPAGAPLLDWWAVSLFDEYEPEPYGPKSTARPAPEIDPDGDLWSISPGQYRGAHYAVFPPALVLPLVKAMTPPRVCRTCGEPSRRVVVDSDDYAEHKAEYDGAFGTRRAERGTGAKPRPNRDVERGVVDLGWTDCGHDDYRPGMVLDPFAGTGTTLAVATGHGFDAIGIDLDERNADLALARVGPLVLTDVVTVGG